MARTPSSRAEAGRPSRTAGLSLVPVLMVLVVLGVLGGGVLTFALVHDDTYVATPPHRAAGPALLDGPRTDLAADTLRAFVAAVRRGDEDAARALAPTEDPLAAARLAGAVANARQARVRGFSARFIAPDDGSVVGRSWSGTADVTWRFARFDRRRAAAEVRVHLRDEGDRVAITGFGGGGHVSPLWLAGPLHIHRTSDTLVLVAGRARPARRYADQARAAVRVVRRVLPAWRAGLVVEVPATQRQLERALHASAGSYDQIAAVTTAPDGSRKAHAPAHVFVNPDLLGDLRPTGAAVVMSHEATHVATDAFASALPLWLLEGFADYVALRDVPSPVDRSAAQILARVRRKGPPSHLPADAAFAARAPGLGATYEAAWLAVREVADTAGEAALVRCYQQADGGTPVARALRRTTGLTVATLTSRWRGELRRLAAREANR